MKWSMLNECRPSLKSTIFTSLGFDTRNNPVLATSGLFGQLKLVRLDLNFYYRDIVVCWVMFIMLKWKPIWMRIFQFHPWFWVNLGLVLHLSSYGGMIRNLSRKNTRYFDRFFLSERWERESWLAGEHIRGYEMADIGPRSKPEGNIVEKGMICRRWEKGGWCSRRRSVFGFRCCCEFPLGIQCQSWNWNPWTTLLESGEYLESQYSLGFLECEDVDLKKIYHMCSPELWNWCNDSIWNCGTIGTKLLTITKTLQFSVLCYVMCFFQTINQLNFHKIIEESIQKPGYLHERNHQLLQP